MRCFGLRSHPIQHLFSDSQLQIFLSLYHGSLIGTFVYDYIIRNVLYCIQDAPKWNYISNIILGAVCVFVIVWAVMSVWARVRRNLLISTLILLVIFIVRLSVGIPDLMDRKKYSTKNQYQEDLTIFISQMVVHLFGVLATYLLAQHA